MKIEIVVIITSMLLVLTVLDFPDLSNFLENSLNCHRNCNAEFFSTFPCCKEEFVTLILACTILRKNRPLAWLMTYHLNSIPAKKKVN